MSDGIDVLLEEILVDAHGDDEQLAAFGQAFDTRERTSPSVLDWWARPLR